MSARRVQCPVIIHGNRKITEGLCRRYGVNTLHLSVANLKARDAGWHNHVWHAIALTSP
jgi:hypothetical protein